jgi:alkylation response protein AidB-like acyl-CoA dehydrogenase
MDYFDLNIGLTKQDTDVRAAAREFAQKVLRPVSIELDAMTAEQMVAPNSPFWGVLKKAYELDFHTVMLPEYYGGQGLTPLQIHLLLEEFGWASFGLAVQLTVLCFPFFLICMSGNDELVETFVRPFCECRDGSIRGCWAITEPDHGSDNLAVGEDFFSAKTMRGNLQAVLDGNEWVINGQKSAWVSGGTIATHALLHCQLDPSKGFEGNGICIVPLDRRGVSRGKPLEKIGQRDLNQGEIFFDDVRIPKSWMLVDPEFYVPFLDIILASANLCMSSWATGLARATLEESLNYSKKRIQGGRPLIEHYSMKERIFHLFRRVETCRALSRAAMNLNFNVSPPLVEYSLVAKTQCTEMAFQNAHEAIQIWGGNGLSKEYIVEKLFRDARATLIEDGNNETLARHGGHILGETYPRRALRF